MAARADEEDRFHGRDATSGLPRSNAAVRVNCVWELRGRSLLRLLPPPHGLTALWILACLGLFVGGWQAIVCASGLVLFEVRSYLTTARADAEGVVISNRLRRLRIPWAEVEAVYAFDAMNRGGVIKTVAVHRRDKVLARQWIEATLYMRREARERVACELVEVARQHGYELPLPSDPEAVRLAELPRPRRASNRAPESPG